MNRNEMVEKNFKAPFDVVVIGGGITGAGVALDAITRGFRVLLLEKADFASGTSSRSTKLIHGGLRYLKQGQLKLVWDTGRERALLHRLAPHLVYPGRMLLPVLKGGSLSKWTASLAVTVYDWLAGVAPRDRKQPLSAEEAHQKEPLLEKSNLLGGILYTEYQTDDARLTLSVARKARELGAVCLNYAEVTGFSHGESGKINGVYWRDATQPSALPVFVEAGVVVNAAGPWVDAVARQENSQHPPRLQLSRGIHLVLPHSRLPIQQAIYFDAPDKRMVFAIPRGATTYVGTTDTFYQGAPESVAATQEEMEYLLDACNRVFPTLTLQPDDVVSSWAGLRPLIAQDKAKPSEISRREEVFISPAGLISIAGGKLTGYRLMAKKVVDLIGKRIKGSPSCQTHAVALYGNPLAAGYSAMEDWIAQLQGRVQQVGLPSTRALYLSRNYGSEALSVLKIFATRAETDPELRLLLAELEYGVQEEQVVFPEDFLLRRTGRLCFELPLVEQYLEPILAAFQSNFNWDATTLAAQRAQVQQQMASARLNV